MDVELTVSGMTCGHCVKALTEELAKLPGVSALAVEVGRARFRAAAPLDEAVLRAAVEEAGYELEAVRRDPDATART